MTINSTVLSALTPVLANSWADELPPRPTYPAIVFNIETDPEESWVLGGGYDQHRVTTIILAKQKSEITAAGALRDQVDAALSAVSGFMYDDLRGDAEYEADASVYGYFLTHVIRLPR
jgi:hypothetical protein